MAEDKAVFMDTGGGDIYAGPTKEAVIAAMRHDAGGEDFIEADVFEVDGDTKMSVEDENERPTEELRTLNEEYVPQPDGKGYCIASNNC